MGIKPKISRGVLLADMLLSCAGVLWSWGREETRGIPYVVMMGVDDEVKKKKRKKERKKERLSNLTGAREPQKAKLLMYMYGILYSMNPGVVHVVVKVHGLDQNSWRPPR